MVAYSAMSKLYFLIACLLDELISMQTVRESSDITGTRIKQKREGFWGGKKLVAELCKQFPHEKNYVSGIF